ncbi:HAD-IA family hydrolase [Streptomyces sp. NPDC047072]|uniref:HAD family hydrolase n=1 Tax=Streptomyces sp. NPDC047072 TaxID=3154809 RepID=UPI003405DA66
MSDAIDDPEAVFNLLSDARAVLFDFDGPVCDLFGGASTEDVAKKVKDRARWMWRTLDQEVEKCDDSHGILRKLRTMYDEADPKPRFRLPLTLAERVVARQERDAVRRAQPTPDIGAVVELLNALELPLAIVSNNAERAIRMYLKKKKLQGLFTSVCGRDPKNAGLMKPHPDCVNRAVSRLSLDPTDCVLVGDQLTDLQAAQEARTPFLGITPDRSRAEKMVEYGATAVVTSYEPVLTALERLSREREASAQPLSPAAR